MSDEHDIGPIHHVGVAVRNIESAAESFALVFGAKRDSVIFVDESQQVRILFMTMHGMRLELLEPSSESSHLWGIVNRGIGIYHTCHETRDLERAIQRIKANGGRIISDPKPAVAFDGRRVAFTMCRGMMVELVESPQATV